MNIKMKQKQKANAVFEGGGVKGIAIAGALTVAARYYDWVYVAGTSAGAIVASLVAAGYTPDEIKDMILDIDYRRFEDSDRWARLPLVGPFLNLEFKLGIYKGNYIEKWIGERLKQKGIERFGDLAVPGWPKDSKWRYRLRVIASDISTGRMLNLPQDIVNYGLDPDYLGVAKAIRMSISIPFFFEPVTLKYWGENGNMTVSYIVDGGVLSNFPVWLFDHEAEIEALPTIGFKLVGPDEGRPHQVRGPLSMLKALFGTMMEAHDNRYILERHFDRTIAIPTLGVRTTDFGISRPKTEELFRSGVLAAERFFQGWDYQRYLIKHAR